MENALKLNRNKFKILNLQNAITYKNEKKNLQKSKIEKVREKWNWTSHLKKLMLSFQIDPNFPQK